jgi:hypothetical protein
MRSGASWISCSSTSWRGECSLAGLRPAGPPTASQKQKQRLPDTSGGGGHGRAGHAANVPVGSMAPSMAPTVLHAHALRPGHIPRARCVHARCSPLVAANLGWQQLTLLFLLTLNFRSRSARAETVRSRSKAAGRTVRRMDAPTEPRDVFTACPACRLCLRKRGAANNAPTSHTAHRSRHPARPQFDVASSAAGGAMLPSARATAPRMPSALKSGRNDGSLNVPAMCSGERSARMLLSFGRGFSSRSRVSSRRLTVPSPMRIVSVVSTASAWLVIRPSRTPKSAKAQRRESACRRSPGISAIR